MFIETFPVGPLQCNCTILGDEATGEAIVIDPGEDIARIHRRLTERGFKLKQILITHGHIDHVGGAVQAQAADGRADLPERRRCVSAGDDGGAGGMAGRADAGGGSAG